MSCTHEMKSGSVVTVVNAAGLAGGCSFCRQEKTQAERDTYGAQCVRYRQGLGQLESMLNLVRRVDGRPTKQDVEDLIETLQGTIREADRLGASQDGEVKP